MIIDNFEKIISLMKFEKDTEFYFIQIISRKKDNPWTKASWVVMKEYSIFSIAPCGKGNICNIAVYSDTLNTMPKQPTATNHFKISWDCFALLRRVSQWRCSLIYSPTLILPCPWILTMLGSYMHSALIGGSAKFPFVTALAIYL